MTTSKIIKQQETVTFKPDSQPIQPKVKNPHKNLKKFIFGTVGGAALLGSAAVGWNWWQFNQTHASTNNAQVRGHISPISPKIIGTVEKIYVKEGDYVKAGQPLVILDKTDFNISLQQARANLAAAQAQLKGAGQGVNLTQNTNTTQIQEAEANLLAKQAAVTAAQSKIEQARAGVSAAAADLNQARSGVETARAGVARVQAQLVKAKADYQRYESLYQQGAVTAQQREGAEVTYQDQLAQLNAAQQQVNQARAEVVSNQAALQQALVGVANSQAALKQAQAEAQSAQGRIAELSAGGQQVNIQKSQVENQTAQVAQAQAQLAQAQQQLNYTLIKAPVSGYVGQLTAQPGQLVQPQQPMLSIVPLDNAQIYVEANFKETALRNIRVGQNATITADAYPGEKFPAKVAGISPATGSEYALIPPDNATGNFNKVVQWVPIRLTLNPGADPGHKLRSGLSVGVTVETGR
ncbi:MAG: Colistin resistance protein EmrA [Chroococcopsis gigantea SAG 12.99]|jgi:membrane fusion protein (multidrug efflux system)|nr:HlyD family secretion protein [Chlorogloea purpurea SAG 13.99]MDV3002051.1 Colistin resistance protein EmrA [Chroococcopsis gigantea SAG 12.99]